MKQYNPEKASAVIIERHIMTNSISFVEKKPLHHRIERKNHDLAVDKNNFYIRAGRYIYIFDKNTLQKISVLEILLPPEYNFLPGNYHHSKTNGLAVIGNKVFIIFLDGRPPYKTYLFSIDLNSGSAQYIDEKTLGFEFVDGGTSNIMGYDPVSDYVWFRIFDWEVSDVIFYLFKYNSDTETLIKVDEKRFIKNINFTLDRHGSMESILIASSIYGNENWNVYLSPIPRWGEEWFIVVDKRSMDDLTKSIAFIDVDYLGTLSVPQSIVYDAPYVWIMVDIDDQLQLLKLLPNE